MDFKVGDIIEVVGREGQDQWRIDSIGSTGAKITCVKDGNMWNVGYTTTSTLGNSWRIIKSNNKSVANLIEKFRLLGKGEPEVSFIKAGVQTMDGSLTAEGKALYDAWKFEKDKEAFNTEVVQKILAADAAEKAK